MFRGLSFVAFLVLAAPLILFGHPGLRSGPVPDFVKEAPLPSFDVPAEPGRSSITLLYERQTRTQSKESYTRYLYKVMDSSGVQNASQVRVDFDPEYESAVIHAVNIWRDGKARSALDLEKVRVLQQEKDLESFQYNGELTALLLLEDIRPGDVIELAYTRLGRNPIFGEHFGDFTFLNWGSPVRKVSVRLISPKSTPIAWKEFGDAHLKLETETRENEFDRTWTATNIPAVEFESNVPSWHFVMPYLEISDFKTWRSVVDWALPLYRDVPDQQKLVAEKTAEVIANKQSSLARAEAILSFVQEEVRYLGIETGQNSHAPRAPDEVLERRYGDCKDKVRLLCAMLHSAGIEAAPALTHSYRQHATAQHLPGPGAFNHVIGLIRIGGVEYWVDPTLSNQGGTLDRRWIPNYSYALPIEKGVTSLARVRPPEATRSTVSVTETFDSSSFDGPAKLTVRTEYRGSGADDMRRVIRETPNEQMLKSLLNHRARIFPKIQAVGKISTTDLRSENRVIMVSQFTVPDLWEKDPKSGVYQSDFIPLSLLDHVANPTDRVRTNPYAIDFPYVCEFETIIHAPKTWPSKPETTVIEDESFQGRADRSGSGQEIVLRYSYKAKSDHVSAERMPEYCANVAKFRDQLRWSLTYNPTIAARNATFRFNWVLLVYLVAMLAIFGAVSFWLYRRDFEIPSFVNVSDAPRLAGISGWLVLVAIGMILRPVIVFYHVLIGLAKLWDARIWAAVSSANRGWVYGEVALQVLCFCTLCLASVLFFQKRRQFPLVFILTFVALLVYSVFEIVVLAGPMSDSKNAAEVAKQIGALLQAGVVSAIWIPYACVSRRVKATFVVRYLRRGGTPNTETIALPPALPETPPPLPITTP